MLQIRWRESFPGYLYKLDVLPINASFVAGHVGMPLLVVRLALIISQRPQVSRERLLHECRVLVVAFLMTG